MVVGRSQRLQTQPANVCLDCPAYTEDAFLTLVRGGKGECAFQCISVEARATIPERWYDAHSVVFIRRGVVIRQRIDAHGRASSIDAAGPGCLYALPDGRQGVSSPTGYAATRVLACLCSRDTFDAALSREDVSRDYMRLQAVCMERVERLAEARSRPDASAAVAALMCTLADTLNGSAATDRVPGALQLRDLASLVGIRHETVCRVMKAFEKDGLIVREANDWLLANRAALEST